MADIFLSYARADRETAAKLARALEDQGFSVWWDPVIPPGDKWAEVIGRQLAAAHCVVVLWSTVSVDKRWVRKEASFAEARNKLIPANLEGVTIPFEFADVQAADLAGWDGETTHEGFQHLVSAISEQRRKVHSEQAEEDILVVTEQAKAEFAEDQEPQDREVSQGPKAKRRSIESGREHVAGQEQVSKRRTLFGKNIIVLGSVSVILVFILFSFLVLQPPSGQKGNRQIVKAPTVTEAPQPAGANEGRASVGQQDQGLKSAHPETATASDAAAAWATGTVVVSAEERYLSVTVYNSDDRKITSKPVNDPFSLWPGTYKLDLNGSVREVSVGKTKTVLETGSILVSAEEKYLSVSVYDTEGRKVTSKPVNAPFSLWPGTYKLDLNGSVREVSVGKTKTVLETGSILVSAEEKYLSITVYDTDGRKLTSKVVNAPFSLWPGTYTVELLGARKQIDVKAGERSF